MSNGNAHWADQFAHPENWKPLDQWNNELQGPRDWRIKRENSSAPYVAVGPYVPGGKTLRGSRGGVRRFKTAEAAMRAIREALT